MKTANTVKTELDQTSNRLSELKQMREGLQQKLENLQDGFIKGKSSLDDVQAAQGKLDTLNSSIRALEAKESELRTAFTDKRNSESHQDILNQMKSCADQA